MLLALMLALMLAAVGVALGTLAGHSLAVVFGAAGAYAGWHVGARRSKAPVRLDRAGPPSIIPDAGRTTLSGNTDALPAYKASYRDLDIVGESYRQDALRALWRLGEHSTFRAVLTPENNNSHDANAVRVDINGTQVGYLSRETATEYRGYMGVQRCAVPVHLMKGGPEGTIGVFTGLSKADKEERSRTRAA